MGGNGKQGHQFQVGDIDQSQTGAVAAGDNVLYYVFPNGDKKLSVGACIDLSNPTKDENWVVNKMNAVSVAFYETVEPESDRAVGAVLLGTYLYAFWADSHEYHHNYVYASRCSLVSDTVGSAAQETAPWSHHIQLFESADKRLKKTDHGGVNAVVFGNLILVTAIANDGDSYKIMAFDPASISADGLTWVAAWRHELKTSLMHGLSGFKLDDGKAGSEHSADWLTDGERDWLVVGLLNKDEHMVNIVTVGLDVDGVDESLIGCDTIADAHKGVCVRRDPGLRVRIYTICPEVAAHDSSDRSIYVRTAWKPMLSPPSAALTFTTSSPTMLNSRDASTTNGPAAGFVLLGSPSEVKPLSPVDESSNTGALYSRDVTEFVLYQSSQHHAESTGVGKTEQRTFLKCQVADYANLLTQENYNTVELGQADESIQTDISIATIIDPYPVNFADLAGFTEGSVFYKSGVVVTNSDSQTSSVSSSTTMSLSSEGYVRFNGIGMAFAAASATTFASATENSTRQTQTISTLCNTQLTSARTSVVRWGMLAAYKTTLTSDVFALTAPGETDLARRLPGPQAALIYPAPYPRAASFGFPCYAVTPGVLESYTAASINARMDELFPKQTSAYRRSGPGNSLLWEDGRYVDDVLLRPDNIVQFTTSGGVVHNYNTAVYTETGGVGVENALSTSETLTSSWTATSSLSSGTDNETPDALQLVPGVSVAAALKAMVGVELSSSTVESSSVTTTIELAVEEPEATGGQIPISRDYRVKRYLLKADNRWTQEIVELRGEGKLRELAFFDDVAQGDTYFEDLHRIDPGSSAQRVVWIVEFIDEEKK